MTKEIEKGYDLVIGLPGTVLPSSSVADCFPTSKLCPRVLQLFSLTLRLVGYSCNVPGPCLLCRYPATTLLRSAFPRTHTIAVRPRSCTIATLIFVISCFCSLAVAVSSPLVALQVVYICKDVGLLVFHT